MVRQLLESDSTQIYRQVAHTIDEVLFDEVLRATDGNQLQAAERLGISVHDAWPKLKAVRSQQSNEPQD